MSVNVKRKIANLAVTATMMTVCLFSSCKNGMQDMVTELDNKLTVQKFETPLPGDEEFDPNTMLSDKYLVSKDSTLCLAAPNAEYYYWQLYRMISSENFYEDYAFVSTSYEEILINGVFPANQKNLILYVPDYYEILTNGTYRLILTVGGSDGNEYVDSVALIIYEPCYDIGDINLPS